MGNSNRVIAAPRRDSGNTPEGLPLTLEALTARSAAFLCQNSNKMKKEYLGLTSIGKAKAMMQEFVNDNSGDVAEAMAQLSVFFAEDCTKDQLKDMEILINTAFVRIGLDIITEREEKGWNTGSGTSLPVDATRLQQSLFTLSNFFRNAYTLIDLMQKNVETPAFVECGKEYALIEKY